MYNGIGILSVRGSGTSGYVQGNKFNLRGGRPVQNRFPEAEAEKGPTQRQPDDSILEHNRNREIELKLIAEEDKLAGQGLTEAEIEEKVADLRTQLKKADEVTPESQQRLVDETHAVAKRKLSQMAKLRDVFGFTAEQDNKEGEAFDRELQEQRKRDRLMEQELKEKAKLKAARKHAKEIRHKKREEKRAIKKAEKQKEKEQNAQRKAEWQRLQQQKMEEAQAKQAAKEAAERAKAAREAPPPERYVPRGPSPVRDTYSSESEEERLPLPPPARTRGRLASQIGSRPAVPGPAPARVDRRSKSLSPDPVKTAINHAEPPRHTKVASPPRSRRPERSSSPAPKRRHTERDVSHAQPSSRGDVRGDAGPSSRRPADEDRGRDRQDPYANRYDSRAAARGSDPAPYGDRNRRPDADRAPYGDRAHADRQLHRSHYEDSRYREGDKSRDRLQSQRGSDAGASREQRYRRHSGDRSVSPPRRKPADAQDRRRRQSPSSSTSSGSSGSSISGSSSSGSGSSSSSSGSGSPYTSSSGTSR